MNKDFLLKYKYIIIVLLAVFCGILIFFIFRFFTPFGAVVKYQFSSILDRDKVSKVKGAEESSSFNPTKAGVLQIPQQTIRQNVVTFNLKLITKPIEGVWVNLRFKGNPKEIKIGVRGAEKENYQYKPLYNQVLNSLSWNKTMSGDTTFWQRVKKYKDILDLISKPPISDEPKVASYFYYLSELAKNEQVSSSEKNLTIEKMLRGTHTLLVRVNKIPFTLNIEKQDNNAYKGEDELLIQIFKNDKKIIEKKIPDDGVIAISSLKMSSQTEKIKINNIPQGIYKVILSDKSNGADVRIKKIESNQSALIFASSIFLYDNKPTILWTNSKTIKMPIISKTNTQIIKLDDKTNLDLSNPGHPYEFDLQSIGVNKNQEIHKLTINKSMLFLSGDGYFAFSKEAFFNPEPIKTVDLSTVSDIEKIDYIIANYQKVTKQGEWYTAQAYFDPKDIKIVGDKLYFSLESPELSSYGGEIVIDNLEVTVKKPGWINKAISSTSQITESKKSPNFFQKIVSFFKNIFSNKNKVPKSTTKKPSPTSKPTPTPDPKTVFSITVFNSGAGKGAAGKFAAILKDAGFTQAEATNAASFDLKNATISYNEKDSKLKKGFIEEITRLLKKSYDIVKQDGKSKKIGKVEIILGENPKDITPTPIATPTLTLTPTPTAKPTP